MTRSLTLGVAILGATWLGSVSSVQAIECAAELPAIRSGHWSYRIIEGRRCWYKGQNNFPKSALHWPKRPVSNAQARMIVSGGPDFVDPEDGSCCWPPLSNDFKLRFSVHDDFETRWRALLESETATLANSK